MLISFMITLPGHNNGRKKFVKKSEKIPQKVSSTTVRAKPNKPGDDLIKLLCKLDRFIIVSYFSKVIETV
jgi:hypothetical protein